MRPAGHQSILRALHKETPTQEWEQPQEKPKYPPHSSLEKEKQMDFWVYVIAAFFSRKNLQKIMWAQTFDRIILFFLSTRNLALNEELNDP